MQIPLIGITTFRTINRYGYPYQSVSQAYVAALTNAGAYPVMLPTGDPDLLMETLVPKLDGVLFTGGGDIHPERYGSQPHPLVADVDTERDHMEIQLFEEVIKRGLPFFGICRGLQLVNVAMGGSLYEDILDQHPSAIKHQYFPDWPREYLAHSVDIQNHSCLIGIIGKSSILVNSLHHQGINRLSPDLLATAYAPDGIIEAIELANYPFGLAVQWHPENLQTHPPMQALFQAFVSAASSQP